MRALLCLSSPTGCLPHCVHDEATVRRGGPAYRARCQRAVSCASRAVCVYGWGGCRSSSAVRLRQPTLLHPSLCETHWLCVLVGGVPPAILQLRSRLLASSHWPPATQPYNSVPFQRHAPCGWGLTQRKRNACLLLVLIGGHNTTGFLVLLQHGGPVLLLVVPQVRCHRVERAGVVRLAQQGPEGH